MLPITFTTNSLSVQRTHPLAIVTKQRYQYLRYAQQVPGHGVAVSYLGLPEMTEKNIFLYEAGPISENTDAYLGLTCKVAVVNSNLQYKFYTRVVDFYLTDQANDTPKQTTRPLWFYHALKDNNGTLVTDYAYLKIYDKDMNEVTTDTWKVVADKDQQDPTVTVYKVYHDLEPIYDTETGLSHVYYITYQIKPTGEKIFHLLDSKRAFERLDNINEVLNRAQRTYTVNPTGSGIFEVATKFQGVINANLYFKPALSGQIRGFKPVAVNNTLSWRLRFTNGGFSATINNLPYRYSIPEFKRQTFYQNRISEKIRDIPAINGANEAIVSGRNLVKSRFAPLYVEPSQGCYLEVIVMDKDGVAYDGYTNNPYKDYWQNLEGTVTIELRDFTRFNDFSFTTESGFIRLPYQLNDGDRVIVNGYYIENYYEYDDLELNPVFNREILDKRVYFYLRPQIIIDRLLTLEDPYNDRGLYHLIVDEGDHIVDYSKDDDGYPADPDFAANPVEEFNAFQVTFPTKLFIAKCAIGRLATPQDVTEIDTRLRGGGIKEQYDLGSMAYKFPEVNWLADYGSWDGKPYPGTASLLVEIPETSTWSGGGNLNTADIRSVVEKHMALGVYPIIKFYGSRPIIREVNGEFNIGANPCVSARWDSVPTAQSYRVYQVLTDQSTVLLIDTEETYCTLVELQTNTYGSYTIKVVPVHDELEGLESDPVMFKVA